MHRTKGLIARAPVLSLGFALLLCTASSSFAQPGGDPLASGFRTPPDSAKPRTWWHWTMSNVTREGIMNDLEWMRRVGIGGFMLADVNAGGGQTVEHKVHFGTPEWFDVVRHAAAEADRLGLEMAIFSSPGWSETGGPWVKPNEAMKKLVWSETTIAGPRRYSGRLPDPPRNNGQIRNTGATYYPQGGGDPTYYGDSAVLAYRMPPGEVDAAAARPIVTTSNGPVDGTPLLDDQLNTLLTIPSPADGGPAWVQFDFPKFFTARAITIAGRGGSANGIPVGRVLASDEGRTFRTLVTLPGPQLYRQGMERTFAFSPTTATCYRIEMTGAPPGPAQTMSQAPPQPAKEYVLSEAILHGGARVQRWEEKAGFSVLFDYAQVPTPVVAPDAAVPAREVIGLTSKLKPDGFARVGRARRHLNGAEARLLAHRREEPAGDWPGGIQSTTTPMVKHEKGVWSATVGPLKPEFWIYTFSVDGVTMLDPRNINTRRNTTRIENTLLVPGPESADFAVNAVPHGTLSLQWYSSPTVNAVRRAYVYTPPGYEAGAGRYPVRYLLHGGSGDEDAWSSCGRATQILDNLIAQGNAKPMIVVVPNANTTRIAAPDLVPAPPALPASQDPGRFPKFPESLVRDLMPFIDEAYRTMADRENRAIAGPSVGGAQAMYTAFSHLDLFAWVAAFSGGYPVMPNVAIDVPPPPNAAGLRGPDLTKSLDPVKFAALMPQLDAGANDRLRLLYISIGTADTLQESHRVVKQVLNDRGLKYTLMEFPGHIHEWPIWRVSLRDLVPRLFQPAAKRAAGRLPFGPEE